MDKDLARQIVGEEMDYWRSFLFEKVKEKYNREYLTDGEVEVCAILGAASAQLRTQK